MRFVIHAVLLAEDIPGDNNSGPVRHDEPVLADKEILFHGQMVAVVVGESPGASKVTKAETLGVPILDQAGFERLLETGELPG